MQGITFFFFKIYQIMVPCTLYTTQALLLLATHVRLSKGWVISGLGSSNTQPNLIGWSISQLIADQKG